MFNEITKKAILEAIKHPGEIDMRMVDAQQARRVLDRLVGYKISPILWDKVRRGLSAGRVQSVALKLICDREREIEAFVPEEYWHVTARLAGDVPPEFDARLVAQGRRGRQGPQRGRGEGRARPTSSAPTFVVSSVQTKERRKNPVPPFITSKLQQAVALPGQEDDDGGAAAVRRHPAARRGSAGRPHHLHANRLGARRPIRRSTRCATTCAQQFGADYVPEQPNRYKVKSNAQDAHEAIRPTSMRVSTQTWSAPHLTPDQFYLYRLIWNRFVASQMTPATFDDTTVDITAGDYLFRAKGSVPKFAGWLAVYGQGTGEAEESERTERPRPVAGATADADDETAERRAAAAQRRAGARAFARSGPNRSSRSRRPGSTKGRSSRRSKRTASAGRAPTRRSSACSRRATT